MNTSPLDLCPALGPCIAHLLAVSARQTNQFMSKMFLASLIRRHPNSFHPRWVVPHMLLMPALQLRNPILQLILMKTNNFPPDLDCVFFHLLPHALTFSAQRNLHRSIGRRVLFATLRSTHRTARAYRIAIVSLPSHRKDNVPAFSASHSMPPQLLTPHSRCPTVLLLESGSRKFPPVPDDFRFGGLPCH